MDLVNLIYLIISREEGEKRDDFEEDAADTPKIHLVAVVAIGEEALWRPVPPGGDVLCIGLLRVDSSARAEVCKLYVIFAQQDVFRLDISMKNAVSVHMVKRFQ